MTRRTELRRPRKRTRPSRRKAGSRQPDPATAYDVAVRLLGQRAHSAVELARKLARRGFEDEATGLVLDRLAEHGYLDDAEYARALVNHRGGGLPVPGDQVDDCRPDRDANDRGCEDGNK